jgi:alanine-synthesizing transaminase
MEKAGVAISPGIGFGKFGEGYIRIALVENEEKIKEAIQSIKEVL